jgi:hypothetical protein
MKRSLQRITIISAVLLAFTLAGSAQIIVKVRPAAPVIVRPVAPSPRHVWIDGGWVVRGGNYVWVDGYYIVPKHGHRWVPGHWAARRGGWAWIPGHWSR